MDALLNFINTHENWMELLAAEPYCIEIKQDGEYFLLKYNQIESNFNEPIVQCCRGCIIKQDEVQLDNEKPSQYHYVCRPFNKFFNYGEAQAATIDWEHAFVTEKVDGSLMKIWYDCVSPLFRRWHLSTNGTIDAFKAPTAFEDLSFGDIFYNIIGIKDFDAWCDKWFDRTLTYMFEMTSKETKVVIDYDPAIYFLAARNTLTGEYVDVKPLLIPEGMYVPKKYDLHTLNDCIDLVSKMSFNEEGVVVADIHGNRIKIKSPEYLYRARLYGSGDKSDEYLIETIFENHQDDLLAYCVEYADRVHQLETNLINAAKLCDKLYEKYKDIEDRKTYALSVKDLPQSGYLFAKRDGKVNTPMEWFKKLTVENLLRLIGGTV